MNTTDIILIDVYVDNINQRAGVLVGGEMIMVGNFWEFHPQAYNIYQYGPFIGHYDLAVQIKNTLKNARIYTTDVNDDNIILKHEETL